MAEASGMVPLHAPIALTRSLPSANDVVSVDSAAGVIIAAPSPWASRAPISMAALAASPPASDDSPNSAVPAISIRRRPNRSAARPPTSRNPP